MNAQRAWERALRASPLALLGVACSTVLGINDPEHRVSCDADCAGASDAGSATIGGTGGSAGRAPQGGASGGGADSGSAGEGGRAESAGEGGGGAASGGASGGAAGDDTVPPECTNDTFSCTAYQRQRCVSGHWQDFGGPCAGYCKNGECKTPPSCESGAPLCLGSTTSCCQTIWVPGNSYEMGKGDGEEDPDLVYARSVGSFYLDRFEVTTGRFNAFLTSFTLPKSGEGAHPKIAGSGWQDGWKDLPNYDFTGQKAVPQSQEDMLIQLKGDCDANGTGGTWGITSDRTLPVNCVNWYAAFAFCAYDGGRLPTEAEWNYAAAGGALQRPYPWSQTNSDTNIDDSLAVYHSTGASLLPFPLPVGSRHAGSGLFFRNLSQGHEDLAGNVTEWVADHWLDEPDHATCSDCMAPWSDQDEDRVVRGGNYQSPSSKLRTGARGSAAASVITSLYGFRCARDARTLP